MSARMVAFGDRIIGNTTSIFEYFELEDAGGVLRGFTFLKHAVNSACIEDVSRSLSCQLYMCKAKK